MLLEEDYQALVIWMKAACLALDIDDCQEED